MRIISNPAFSRDAVSAQEAVKVLEANVQHPSHQFWADEISFTQAVMQFGKRLEGHRQVTDAYLLGLAMHKKGRLVTLDRGVLELLPAKSSEREFVEVL